MLCDMDIAEAFDADIRVPPISSLDMLAAVLDEIGLFRSEDDRSRSFELLHQAGFSREGRLNIGVKRVLGMAEMARNDRDPADKLVARYVSFYD